MIPASWYDAVEPDQSGPCDGCGSSGADAHEPSGLLLCDECRRKITIGRRAGNCRT